MQAKEFKSIASILGVAIVCIITLFILSLMLAVFMIRMATQEWFLGIMMGTGIFIVLLTIVVYAKWPILRSKRVKAAVDIAFIVLGLGVFIAILDIPQVILQERAEYYERLQNVLPILRAVITTSDGEICRIPNPEDRPPICSAYVKGFKLVEGKATVAQVDEFLFGELSNLLGIPSPVTNLSDYFKKNKDIPALGKILFEQLFIHSAAREQLEKLASPQKRIMELKETLSDLEFLGKPMGLVLALLYFSLSIARKFFDDSISTSPESQT